ncbi:MAG TPA: tetratricopeptide repeat protein [Woeseiaceae bacterium]|nr:tetratricopeptide repeat protein [Woeseiaceae bacterium]
MQVRAYSTREVADLAGLPEGRVRSWARAGLVTPHRDERGRLRFSFQDLAVLRTAGRLLGAGVSVRRVTRALSLLRSQLPEGRPLSAVRVLVTGERVLVRDRLASWEPESGQCALDFEVQAVSAPVAPPILAERPPRSEAERARTADELYQAALDLELAGRTEAAREVYEAVLRCDPARVAARINLGRLLHAAGRTADAEAMYRAALEQEPQSALAAFNLGVALEDQGKTWSAVEAYRAAIGIDESYADAHYNLSRLLEAQGDARGALRHLNHFRRLMKGE